MPIVTKPAPRVRWGGKSNPACMGRACSVAMLLLSQGLQEGFMQHVLCPALGERVVRSFEQLHVAAAAFAQAGQDRTRLVRKQRAAGIISGVKKVQPRPSTRQSQQLGS